MDQCYTIRDVSRLLSPSLVIFKEILLENIEVMLRMAGRPERLRPHCKTHKMPAVIKLLLERGITRHKCATLAEAEMLALAGVTDVCLAYPIVGPNIGRVIAYRHKYPQVDLMIVGDDSGALAELGSAATRAGVVVSVLLEINPGRDRTGLPVGAAAVALYAQIANTPGLSPAGLHVYDGHQNQAVLTERVAAVHSVLDGVLALRDQLVGSGLSVPRIIAGGAPTFPAYEGIDEPTLEVSPGTNIFHDVGYGEKYPDLNVFTPAALVLTRVISRPTANRVTFDLGTKAVASDPPMGQRVKLPDLPDAVQVLHNEEHLVVETPSAANWHVGDHTLAIPRHVCPTSALHRQAYVISQGTLSDTWDVTARDRVLTI